MKTIQLTKGHIALVSDEDYERCMQGPKWHAFIRLRRNGTVNNVYAQRNLPSVNGKQTKEQMHRFILNITDPEVEVDHSPDHSGLNNTRENLRPANHDENVRNQRMHADNTSGVKGVNWHKSSHKWIAQICVNGKHKYVGLFTFKEDAAAAYDAAALNFHGEFALTNAMLAAAQTNREYL